MTIQLISTCYLYPSILTCPGHLCTAAGAALHAGGSFISVITQSASLHSALPGHHTHSAAASAQGLTFAVYPHIYFIHKQQRASQLLAFIFFTLHLNLKHLLD